MEEIRIDERCACGASMSIEGRSERIDSESVMRDLLAWRKEHYCTERWGPPADYQFGDLSAAARARAEKGLSWEPVKAEDLKGVHG